MVLTFGMLRELLEEVVTLTDGRQARLAGVSPLGEIVLESDKGRERLPWDSLALENFHAPA